MDQTGLVERARRGDHDAFGVLVGAHLARLDAAARLRALIASGDPRRNQQPVVWNSWGRDRIIASGIDDPLRFLTRGPPRLAIRKCAGLELPADQLAVACASHGGEPLHVRTVRQMLAEFGLTEESLANTPALPLSDDIRVSYE